MNKHWFHFQSYVLTGKSSASILDSYDNSEGIAAFDDIDFPRVATSFADFGGGPSDEAALYMKNKYDNIKHFFILDPFNRSFQHNIEMQSNITSMGGVDIVTCMSVLNIIPTYRLRIHLISIMYEALKEGGYAYFKVWAGTWPERGSGRPTIDHSRNIFQANKWADGFRNEVAKVFGARNVYVDNNMNLIVAKKTFSFGKSKRIL